MFNFLVFCGSFYLLSLYTVKAETIQGNYSTNCELNYTASRPDSEFFFKCKVSLRYLHKNSISCTTYGADTIMTVGKPEHVMDAQVKCISNHPVFVKIDHEDGIVELPSIIMEWQRHFTDFNNFTTYLYEVHFFTPKRTFIKSLTFVRRTLFKYTVYTSQFPEKPFHLLFFDSAVSHHAVRIGDVHIIRATQEMMNIPCIIEVSRKIVLKTVKEGFYNDNTETMAVNNVSVSYHSARGFSISSTLLSNFDGILCDNSDGVGKLFIIIPQPDFTSSTLLHHIIAEPPILKAPFFLTDNGNKTHTFIYDFQHSIYDLICTSITANLTFEAEYNNNTKQQVYDVIYTNTDKPERIYTSTVVFTNPTNESEIKIRCFNPSTERIYHTWVLNYDGLNSDKQKSKDMFSVHYDGTLLKCLSSDGNETNNSLDFKQIECNNLFSCKELSKDVIGYSSRSRVSCEELSEAVNEYPLLSRVSVGSQCWVNNGEEDLKNCKSLVPFNKGFFQCSADKGKHGGRVYQDVYYFGFDGKFYIGNAHPPKHAVMKIDLLNRADHILTLPGNYTFVCETHSFYFEKGIQWFFLFQNGTQIIAPLENITDIPLSDTQYKDSSNLIRSSSFHLEDISLHRLICAAPVSSILSETTQYKWEYLSTYIPCKNAILPSIKKSKDVIEKHFRIGYADQLLNCDADGFPAPEITWTIKGQMVTSPFKITGSHNNLLQFPIYNESYAGEYMCTAINSVGTVHQIFSVHTNSSYGMWSIVAIALSVIIVLAIPPIFIIIRRLQYQIKHKLTDKEMKEFMEGKALDGNDIDEIYLSQPYDQKYEMPNDKFRIDLKNMLGKGAFGIVFKGTVDLPNFSGDVAFKTVRPDCGKEIYKSLLSELKIMISVEQHPNIICLIGAYTKEIKNGIVYIATELCTLGSLESYLRKNKGCFSRDIDVEFPYENLMEYTNMSSKMFSVDLLFNWSIQIANGMEYLASKYIVHSDLATRNVLLDSNKMAKITDFGLSRKMYNYYDYVKKDAKKDPLPWKWMAIESLLTMKFSTHSDVWAYGVTIWEIFSFGSVPYPGISWTVEFLNMLENGLRNPKPKHMNTKIYDMLLSCWNINPKERPSFNSLKLFFTSFTEIQYTVIQEKEVPLERNDVAIFNENHAK